MGYDYDRKNYTVGYSGTCQKVKFQNSFNHDEGMTNDRKSKLFSFQSGLYTFELVLFTVVLVHFLILHKVPLCNHDRKW